MQRIKVKGTKFKAASSPEQEPDFYRMPIVVVAVTPNHSSDEEASQDSSSSVMNHYQQQHASSYPMQQSYGYSSSTTMPQVTTSNYFTQPAPLAMPSPLFSANSNFAFQQPADTVLDQAVDELFMGELASEDTLNDFVSEWDPTSSFGAVLENDIQLGYMLERLLED